MVHSSSSLPPLDTLETFAAAAKLGSFSAAAEALDLTHGAVSRQISRLERWMGVRLFHRQARGVALTPEGERFRAKTLDALALLEDAPDRWSPRWRKPVVRLSLTPSVATLWVFPLMRSLEQDDISLQLTMEHRLADFDENVDLAIRCGRGPWPTIRSTLLWPEDLRPLASPQLAQEIGASPSGERLLNWPLLHDSTIEGWRIWLAAAGASYEPRPQDRRFEDYTVVLEACANHLGIALARAPIANPMLASGRLVHVSPLTSESPIGFHLVRPDEPLRGATVTLAHRLLKAAGHSDAAAQAFVA